MKILNALQTTRAGYSAAIFSLLVLAACATAPSSPPGASDARSKLSALQQDPNLANRAPLELREAETAVRVAEQPLPELESSLGEHRVYMAERKIEIAKARATGRYAMDQRAALIEEREQARLIARTREAESARAAADLAQNDALRARNDASRALDEASAARYAEAQATANAEAARRDAEAARLSEARISADAQREAADLQSRISALEAEITDRGLVLTLGDLLFATDRANLEPGADRHLERLVSFLERYPERRVQIEGHTDNVGSGDYNLGLSRRRAESVMYYLTQHGIDASRLSVLGLGQERPIASNSTAAGRQQNRRVEIIIENPSQTLARE